jgi:diguanylate cyclase (GGDEF)-like protein
VNAANRLPRVLVVDDDATMCLIASETLAAAGYQVRVAGSGEEGVALFTAAPADLVLLDVLMPGLDGFQVCRLLRQLPGGDAVPIIVMTGLDDRDSIHQAYDSGATDFLTKPLLPDLLPYRVRYALRATHALHQAMRSQALLASSQRIAHMGSWEWQCGERVLERSEEWFSIHGRPRAAASGSLDDLFGQVHAEDRPALENALRQALAAGVPYQLDYRLLRPDGSPRRVFEETDIELDPAGKVKAVRGIVHDITQKTEDDHRIHRLAYFDPLTGLGNRALFRELMQKWLPYSARRGLGCAVMIVGLDRFKLINESLGPAIGDEVLQAVGERLRVCVRADDIASEGHDREAPDRLARLGSDEFTILLVDISDPEQILRVGRRIMASLGQPILIGSHKVTVSAGIGIAMVPQDGDTVDSLLRNAETAMHVAKDSGHSQACFYNPAMSASVAKRLSLEGELRHALEEGQFRLVYQAKVDARTSTIVGAEALIRWQRPGRSVVNPLDFIPVAEECGLILPMTDWIIDTVCRQIAEWKAQGLPVVPVSINIAGLSFQKDGLVGSIRQAMASHGVAAGHLEFEVTESSLIRDLERTRIILDEMKALGLRVSIDDFGTGYSSLTYLKRFPVDVLKIDRSFITDLSTDENDAALTSAIIAMGNSLKLELIAEGVETWDHAHFLLARGCHLMQGYLFAKPFPAEWFAELLRSGIAHNPPPAG